MRLSRQNQNQNPRRPEESLGTKPLGRPLARSITVISHLLVLCMIFGGLHIDYGCYCPDCACCQSSGLSQPKTCNSNGCCCHIDTGCCHADTGCCCRSTAECPKAANTADQSGCKCCEQPKLSYQAGVLDPVITLSPLVFVHPAPKLAERAFEHPLDSPSGQSEFRTGKVPVHLLNCVWQI